MNPTMSLSQGNPQTQNVQIQPRPITQQMQSQNIQIHLQSQQPQNVQQHVTNQMIQQPQQSKIYTQQYVQQLIRGVSQQQQQPNPQTQFQQTQHPQQVRIQIQNIAPSTGTVIQQQQQQQQFNKPIIQPKSLHSSSPSPSPSPSPSSSVVASTSSNQTVNQTMTTIKVATRIDDDDDLISDVTAMVGIDLAAEKKSLLDTAKSSTLDQIRTCKDEKFLNINVLHKKFEDIGNLTRRND